MSYYEEIVAEFLCSSRQRFVSPGYNLDLGGVGPHGKGRNWWIDVLAVDFQDETIYLCEATFARQPTYMLRRLSAWAAVWTELCNALYHTTSAPKTWRVIPWISLQQSCRAGSRTASRRLKICLLSTGGPLSKKSFRGSGLSSHELRLPKSERARPILGTTARALPTTSANCSGRDRIYPRERARPVPFFFSDCGFRRSSYGLH
jgi:hypothetical protein